MLIRPLSAATSKLVLLSVFALALLAGSLDSASARDPRPTTYREKARHDFRDVQLGLCHPAGGDGKSVPCDAAVKAQKTQPKK